MRRATQTPQIPTPSSDNVIDVVTAVKEVIEVREGRRGDPLDKAVTFRDLEALQLVQRPEDAQWDLEYTGGLPVVVPPWVNPIPSSGQSYNPETDFSVPPAPQNLIASGAYSSINLSWVYPSYRNHGYTEVWRSTVNDLSTAALIGTNQATVYNDPVGTEKRYYYWVRNVSKANVKSEYNSLTGVLAETAVDVARRISELETEVLGDNLTKTLGERVFALEETQGSLSSSVSTLTTSLAQQTQVLSNATNGNRAAIQVQQTVSEGLSAQYTVKIDNNGFVSGFGLASEVRNGTPKSSFTVLADRFSIVNPNTRKLDVSSISVVNYSQNAVSSLTHSAGIASCTTTNPHNLSVGHMFYLNTTVAEWKGYYKVRTVDNANTITFFVDPSIASAPVGAHVIRRFHTATVSTASDHGIVLGESIVLTGIENDRRWNGTWTPTVVTSNQLVINVPPNYSSAPLVVTGTQVGRSSAPFIVEDGKVYIDTALIRNATITSAQIASLAADKITTGNLTATVDVTTGVVKSSVSFGGAGFWLGSDGGTQKFYIGDGSTKYVSWNGTDLSVAGTVTATAGAIGGITIQSNNLRSSNYVASTSGWTITSAGVAEFSNISARGITIYNSAGQILLSSGGNIDGTYIANSTVGSISIAADAATVPAFNSSSSAVTISSYSSDGSTDTWYEIVSLVVNYGTSAQGITTAKGLIGFTIQHQSGGGGEWCIRWRVIRADGTVIGYGEQGVSNNQLGKSTVSAVVYDNAANNGSRTYKLEVANFGNVGSARVVDAGAVIYAIGAKR